MADQGIEISDASSEMRIATMEEDVKQIKVMVADLHARTAAVRAGE